MLRYCWVLPLSNEPKHNYVGPVVTEPIDFLLCRLALMFGIVIYINTKQLDK